jgi:hypothetical protein
MRFEILTEIRNQSVIASGRAVRARRRLMRRFGGSNWRKMKGRAVVRTQYNEIYEAEIHWYEAHGVGKREFKIKEPGA